MQIILNAYFLFDDNKEEIYFIFNDQLFFHLAYFFLLFHNGCIHLNMVFLYILLNFYDNIQKFLLKEIQRNHYYLFQFCEYHKFFFLHYIYIFIFLFINYFFIQFINFLCFLPQNFNNLINFL